ncbi:MAG: hypothetical protein ACOCZ8_02765 [Bacteroidota bacterium]
MNTEPDYAFNRYLSFCGHDAIALNLVPEILGFYVDYDESSLNVHIYISKTENHLFHSTGENYFASNICDIFVDCILVDNREFLTSKYFDGLIDNMDFSIHVHENATLDDIRNSKHYLTIIQHYIRD